MTKNNKSETGNFAEHTVLTELFGDHPRTKILAVLLKEGRDTNVSNIAELSGMSRSTVYRHIDPLVTIGVVEKTREIGGSPMYQLNQDSDVAEKLSELEWELLDAVASDAEDSDFEIPETPPEKA